MSIVTSKLRWSFFAGILLGLLPLILHLMASFFIAVSKLSFVIDIVLFGLAICIGGFMSGVKFINFASSQSAQEATGKVSFLIALIAVEIGLLVAAYMAVLIDIKEFKWKYILISMFACFILSIPSYLVEVRFTAKHHAD